MYPLICRCIFVTIVNRFSVWIVIYLFTRHYIPVQDVQVQGKRNSWPKWRDFLDKNKF